MGASLRSPSVSNVELLSVLEVQIPRIRAAYQLHTPIMLGLTEWEQETLTSIDTKLQKRDKTQRTSVDEALRLFSAANIRNESLAESQIDTARAELLTCLMVIREFSQMKTALDTVLNTYQLPFKALVDRVVSRSASYATADELHQYYGVFTQSVRKFATHLQTCQELAGRVMDYQPFFSDMVSNMIELNCASTDAYNALVKLNHIHHKNLEYVNRSYSSVNY